MTTVARIAPQRRQYSFRTGPRRPLARTLRPVNDETLRSYLTRLAATNRIPLDDLVAYLDAKLTTKTSSASLQNLAMASRQSARTLAYALPDLAAQYAPADTMALQGRTLSHKPNIVRPACRHCAPAKGIIGQVWVWTRHDQNICLRHRRWIGGGVSSSYEQIDLSGHPDILRAQIRHRRLIRRHGRQITKAAYDIARELWADLTWRGYKVPYFQARDLRLTRHYGHTQ